MLGELFILNEIELWKIIFVFFGGILASFIGTAVGGDGFVYLMCTNILNLPSIKIFGCYKWFAAINASYSIIKYKKQKSITAYKFFKFCFPYGILLWIPSAYIGSVLSTKYASYMLNYILPFITISLALYKTFAKPKIRPAKRRMSPRIFFYVIVTLIFFYIGFFGPGSGTFVILLSSYFLSFSLRNGSVLGRHIDLFANLVSVIIFTFSKNLYIDLILLMALAGVIGSKLSMEAMKKHSVRFLEILLIVMLYFISCVYFYQIFFADQKKCYQMENKFGKQKWIKTKINTRDECFTMDSCSDGLGKSGGECFKWAKSANQEGDPW